jgi:hypothetical protein
MFDIDFNLFDHNFCEATIYSTGQHPEYLNSFSSLFISFIGILGLIKPHNYLTLSMTSACLVVNGVFSFMYHYYNSIGWGLLDRMSMVILAINATYLFINDIIQKYPKYKNVYHLLIASYYSLLLTVGGLHKEQLFNTMFGLFLISLSYFMYNLTTVFYIPYEIKRIGWRGIWCIVSSGVFWIGTEALCSHFSFIKYMFGHVWWHVLVSIGGHYISLVPKYLNMIKRVNMDETIVIVQYDRFRLPYLTYNNIV